MAAVDDDYLSREQIEALLRTEGEPPFCAEQPSRPAPTRAPHPAPARRKATRLRRQPFPVLDTDPSLDQSAARRSGALATAGWSLASLATALVLALQLVYLQRVELARHESLRPWVEALCRVAGCQLPLRRDPAAIDIARHSIQAHPHRQGALLITAQLINRAPFPQPFPVVEIVMTDLALHPVARRTFSPEDYLAAGVPKEVFAPGQQAELRLEVTDPGPAAVSFEFTLH